MIKVHKVIGVSWHSDVGLQFHLMIFVLVDLFKMNSVSFVPKKVPYSDCTCKSKPTLTCDYKCLLYFRFIVLKVRLDCVS